MADYATRLEQAVNYAKEISAADDTIELLEKQIKEISKRRNELACERLPEILDEIGLSELKLSDGRSVEIKNTIRASIPTDAGIARMKDVAKQREAYERRRRALEWLRKNDLGDLIKNEVSMQFVRGQETEANELVSELNDRGYDCYLDSVVNSNTLSAQVRELLESGQEVPMEDFSVQIVREAVIK